MATSNKQPDFHPPSLASLSNEGVNDVFCWKLFGSSLIGLESAVSTLLPAGGAHISLCSVSKIPQPRSPYSVIPVIGSHCWEATNSSGETNIQLIMSIGVMGSAPWTTVQTGIGFSGASANTVVFLYSLPGTGSKSLVQESQQADLLKGGLSHARSARHKEQITGCFHGICHFVCIQTDALRGPIPIKVMFAKYYCEVFHGCGCDPVTTGMEHSLVVLREAACL